MCGTNTEVLAEARLYSPNLLDLENTTLIEFGGISYYSGKVEKD